ncbi:MAG TPA: hypothetical protein VF300_04285 [Methanothrix sp.]
MGLAGVPASDFFFGLVYLDEIFPRILQALVYLDCPSAEPGLYGQLIELIYKIRYRLKPESHKIGTKLEISEIVQELLFIVKGFAKTRIKLLNSSSYMGLKFCELLRLFVSEMFLFLLGSYGFSFL